ncbi:hypothetical protein [Natrinema soli]|uniref:Uncharacterized protein n=1 Tax=Natrinema soli TaxID=1930624 RepID=A0ABD5SKA9_9EURY|nr:hypothetical protein [Natrinema soli]
MYPDDPRLGRDPESVEDYLEMSEGEHFEKVMGRLEERDEWIIQPEGDSSE